MKNTSAELSQKVSKKLTRQEVYQKLEAALSDYKEAFKEKKFARNLKIASKLFAADIAKTIKKKVKHVKLQGVSKQAS